LVHCSYWKGNSSLEELLKVGSECENAAWTLQKQTGWILASGHLSTVHSRVGSEESSHLWNADFELCLTAGIDRIGLDGTLYDQVLDFIFYLGLAPKRFQVTLQSKTESNASLATSNPPTKHCNAKFWFL
jgi:hypothetical protein